MNTTFFLKKSSNSNDGVICFLFSVGRTKIKFSTGIAINQKDWAGGFPKKTNSTSEIRNLLNTYRDKIDRFINETIRNTHNIPTRDMLRNQCNLITKGTMALEADVLISKLANEMILEQSDFKSDKRLNNNTIRYKKIHFQYFLNFIGKYKRVSEFNQKLIDQYRQFLHNDSNENVTKNSHLKSIISFYNWLKKKRYITENIQFDKFTEIEKNVVALTPEEIKILEEATNLLIHEQNQIDIFLFGCYTALSISDLQRIEKDMIENDTIFLYRKKTEGLLQIPLLPQAKKILEKHDYKLPHIHKNKGNSVLKSAFKKLNLDRKVMTSSKRGSDELTTRYVPLYEVISWHKARKTAITYCLSQGISPILVQELSGHKDYRSFKKYTDLSDLLRKEMMDKLSR